MPQTAKKPVAKATKPKPGASRNQKSTVGQKSTARRKSTVGQKSTVRQKSTVDQKSTLPARKADSRGSNGGGGSSSNGASSNGHSPVLSGLAGKAVKRLAKTALPAAGRAMRSALEKVRDATSDSLLARARELPIQRSVDVAVPIDVAWDEWQRFEFLPEGTHKVADVERDGDDHLVGRVTGMHVERDWEAEIVDERIDESFAWHSMGSSDTSGLVTFHELGERLTRIELHLDVIPGGVRDAVALMLRVADRRAEAELRRFKAHVEALDPDEYPPVEDEEDDDDQVPDEQDESDESDA